MELRDFFRTNNRVAIALSGGVDSAFLLSEAVRYGADVMAYYVKSSFQPEFERQDALRIAEMTGAAVTVLNVDALANETVASNPEDRCYHCKINIMGTIKNAAAADGFDIICDGTNASDDAGDRPGMKALRELGIRSPLRECGITKSDVRKGAREAGLDIWDKPSYACLATRIRTGERITEDKLRRTEEAEARLMEMGFSGFRIRMRGSDALVQMPAEQIADAFEKEDGIKAAIGQYYDNVVIDSQPRISE